MSPTIVLRNDQPRLVVGAQGGPAIITSVTLVILNVLDFGMNVQQAVDFPRFHHQWMPDLLYLEPAGFAPETRHALEALGHRLSFDRGLGHVEAIEVLPEVLTGGADSRSEGCGRGASEPGRMLYPVDFLAHYGRDFPKWSLEDSTRYTRRLASKHYENFLVASLLVPKRLRQDYCNIYAFCRWADDLGDETGDPAESLALLAGGSPSFAAFSRGAHTIPCMWRSPTPCPDTSSRPPASKT